MLLAMVHSLVLGMVSLMLGMGIAGPRVLRIGGGGQGDG
jgi:hypothetical protein